MNIKQKFNSIDQSKLDSKQVEILKNIEQKTDGFKTKDKEIISKIDTALDKIISALKDKNPEAIKTKTTSKTKSQKSSGGGKRTLFSIAKDIRKSDETWEEAKNRAKKIMEDENKQTTQKMKSETEKLLAFIKRKKELDGLSGTSVKKDSKIEALPKGRRVSKKGWKNQYGESEGGRVYYENRDNRTDRLAPNFSDKIYLAGGGYANKGVYVETLDEEIDLSDDAKVRARKTQQGSNKSYSELREKHGGSPEALAFANGGYVVIAKSEKGGGFVMSKPTTKAKAEKLKSLLPKINGESNEVMTIGKASKLSGLVGKEYLKYADGGNVIDAFQMRTVRGVDSQPTEVLTNEQKVEFANGGGVDNDITNELQNFDIENLDPFEKMQYNQFYPSLGKVGALQVLINNVEGDYSQLSEELSELAEKQMSMDDFNESTREMLFERDGYANGGTLIGVPETPLARGLDIDYTGLVGETGGMSAGEMFAMGGSLGNHGLKQGDQIIKTMSGGVQKVKTKSGDIVYVNLANGYRGAEPPLPFDKGGKLTRIKLGDTVRYKDEAWYLYQKKGVVGIVNMKQGAWGSDFPFIPLSKIDIERELKDFYGNPIKKGEIPYLVEDFAKGGYTNERRHVNKAQDYEVRYAKNKPNRTGYLGKRSFDDGGIIKDGDKVVITTKSLGEKYLGMRGVVTSRKLLNDKYSIELENGMTLAFDKDEFRHNSINPRYEQGGSLVDGYLTDPNFGDFQNGVYDEGGFFEKVKWQDVEVGDSARVKEINRMGLVVKTYGRKFHLKFPNGTEKTFDASELEFFKLENEDYATGGGVGKLSFDEWMKQNNIDVYKRTYYWVADDGGNDYLYSGSKSEVMKSLKEDWKKTQTKKTPKQLRNEYLEKLGSKEADVWDKIGAESGSQIRNSDKMLKSYAEGVEEMLQKEGVGKGSFDQEDYDFYTDENWHLFNEFLVWNGYYEPEMTKTEKAWREDRFKDPKYKNYVANPSIISLSGSSKSKSKSSKYIVKADIKEVKVKTDAGYEYTFKGSDVLNGVNVLEKGSLLKNNATYVAKRNIMYVELKNGERIKPANGYWIKKDAKGELFKPKNKDKKMTYEEFLKKRPKSVTGKVYSADWGGENGKMVNRTFYYGYSKYVDRVGWFNRNKGKSITDEVAYKLYLEQPSTANDEKFEGGGKTTFKEKATAIAKKFEGKKVEPKYQKEYGKTYDKAEAKEVGNKIAGSQKAKYDSKIITKKGFASNDYDVIVKLPNGLTTKKDFEGFSKEEVIEWCENRGWKYNNKAEKQGGYILKDYEFFVKTPTLYNTVLPNSKGKTSKSGSTKRGGAMQLAKQIRKEGESWQSALKRANEQMRKK